MTSKLILLERFNILCELIAEAEDEKEINKEYEKLKKLKKEIDSLNNNNLSAQ